MAKTALKEVETTALKLRLAPHNLQGKEYAVREFRAFIDPGHTVEDILKPDYWGHVSRKFSKNAMIIATAKDGSFYAQLWVYDVGETWVRTRVVVEKHYDNVDDLAPDVSGFTIDHVESGWRVLHKETKQALITGLLSRQSAEDYIKISTRT